MLSFSPSLLVCTLLLVFPSCCSSFPYNYCTIFIYLFKFMSYWGCSWQLQVTYLNMKWICIGIVKVAVVVCSGSRHLFILSRIKCVFWFGLVFCCQSACFAFVVIAVVFVDVAVLHVVNKVKWFPNMLPPPPKKKLLQQLTNIH